MSAPAGAVADRPGLPSAAVFALTWLGCLLLSLLALPLTIVPGFAVPFEPAAGAALAAVLLRGPSMAIAGGLAAAATWLVRLAWLAPVPATTAVTWLLPLAAGVGAALQAYLGSALMTRRQLEPLALAEPADVARFFVAAIAAAPIGTAFVQATLAASGWVRVAELPLAFGAGWIGAVLGTLVAVPVILAAHGRSHPAWVSRRQSVGYTLSAMALLIWLGLHGLAQQASAQNHGAFRRDADRVAASLSGELLEPLRALQGLRGLFEAVDDVTADEMRRAMRGWLRDDPSRSFGWSVPVQAVDVAAFEASARAAGQADFRVRPAPGASAPRAGDRSARRNEERVVLRYVEPLPGNGARLGTDAMSSPAARGAVDRARASGRPAAGLVSPTEVVVYQALYAEGDAPAAPARAALRGLVSVSIRPDALVARLAGQDPALWRAVNVCLVDTDPAAGPVRVAGPTDCASVGGPLVARRSLRFADRDWEIVVTPAPPQRGVSQPAVNRYALLFALAALVSTGLLATFLLTVTGRARRIELAVRQRTAALQAVAQDRQAAEHALRDSEQRFREILDHVPIGVVYTDLDGRIRQANLHFCQLAGADEAALIALNTAELTHPDDIEQDRAATRQLLRGEIPLFRSRRRLLARTGEVVWVQIAVSLMRGAQGQPSHLVSVVEDVTEHRLLEEAERGREAAEAANRAKSDFLSRMSHELRTPLNAMLGFAQLLELDPKQPLSPSQKPWVVQIQQAGWHLLEMINDMLDLSRIESGNLQLRVGPLDLRELVASTCAMVEADARERGITITQTLDLGAATPLGDPTRVKQILTNLLTNAVKYNADAGGIRITASMTDGEHVQLVVADTGLGMTPEQLAGLFQPFNRLGRERSSQAPGTGIGLVISQRLAELMGGTLTAESVAGEGSAFILALPCSTEPDTVRSELDETDGDVAHYHRRHVHYVEDNETNVEVMRGMLAQRPQVELSVSVTGLDGLAAIRTSQPDLILLDMNLPDVSGMELLRHLKRDPGTRRIPIVVVSADALTTQIEAAFDAGCERYLTKPVSVSELLAVVDEVLGAADTLEG